MQNCQDSLDAGLQADRRECNQVANPLVSCMPSLGHVAQDREAGERQMLLFLSTGPHE